VGNGAIRLESTITRERRIEGPDWHPGFSISVVSCLTNGGIAMEIGFEIILIVFLCVIGVKVQHIDANVKALLRDRK